MFLIAAISALLKHHEGGHQTHHGPHAHSCSLGAVSLQVCITLHSRMARCVSRSCVTAVLGLYSSWQGGSVVMV